MSFNHNLKSNNLKILYNLFFVVIFFNWYQLLKLLQKHGTIEKFDLLFHRSGPLIGQPRGYAFVTFSTKEEAITAKENLHNLLVGNKRINVTWAHSINNVISYIKIFFHNYLNRLYSFFLGGARET